MDDFLGFGILGVKAREVPSKADQLTTLLATVNPVGPGFRRQVSQGSSMALWGLPTPCLVLGPGGVWWGLCPEAAGLLQGAALLFPARKPLWSGRSFNRQEVESSAPVRFLWCVGRSQSPGFGPSGWLQTLFSAFSRKESSRARESDERRAPVSCACERAGSSGLCPQLGSLL